MLRRLALIGARRNRLDRDLRLAGPDFADRHLVVEAASPGIEPQLWILRSFSRRDASCMPGDSLGELMASGVSLEERLG